MVPKKYANDYRLENVTGPKGGIKTVPVYTGPRFDFVEPGRLPGLKRGCAALLAAACLMFLGGLFVNGFLPRRIYVVGPYAFALLPYAYMWMALGAIRPGKGPFTREQKDKSAVRLRNSAFLAWIFQSMAALGSLGTAVFAFSSLSLPGDALFLTLTLLQAALCGTVFFAGRKFAMGSV